jgi:hypothetical protein
VKGWKIICQTSGNWKQGGVVIIISDNVDFKPKLLRIDKGHYILIKRTIHHKDIMIVDLHVLNFGAPNFIKQTPKGQMNQIQ